jgi:hypothetical protein
MSYMRDVGFSCPCQIIGRIDGSTRFNALLMPEGPEGASHLEEVTSLPAVHTADECKGVWCIAVSTGTQWHAFIPVFQ